MNIVREGDRRDVIWNLDFWKRTLELINSSGEWEKYAAYEYWEELILKNNSKLWIDKVSILENLFTFLRWNLVPVDFIIKVSEDKLLVQKTSKVNLNILFNWTKFKKNWEFDVSCKLHSDFLVIDTNWIIHQNLEFNFDWENYNFIDDKWNLVDFKWFICPLSWNEMEINENQQILASMQKNYNLLLEISSNLNNCLAQFFLDSWFDSYSFDFKTWLNSNWQLLLTTDLDFDNIDVERIYIVRWPDEKPYLYRNYKISELSVWWKSCHFWEKLDVIGDNEITEIIVIDNPSLKEVANSTFNSLPKSLKDIVLWCSNEIVSNLNNQ